MVFANENILSGHGPEITTFTVPQNGSPVKSFVLLDMEAPDSTVNVVDLLNLQDSTSYTTFVESGGSVVVVAKEAWTSADVAFTATASEVDATLGSFTVRIPATGTTEAGLYLLEFSVYAADGDLVLVNHSHMDIVPSLAAVQAKSHVSIPMIRRMMRDAHPRGNRVLEECEFSLQEIVTAVQVTMDRFNASPPQISTRFSIPDFPWPIQLMRGAIGELLKMAALWYERNDLKVKGGGLSIDDMGKSKTYFQIGQTYEDEWLGFTAMTKRNMNVSGGWAHLKSGFF